MPRAWGRMGPISSSLLELFLRILVCRVGVQGFRGTLADRYGSPILEDTLGTDLQFRKGPKNDRSDHRFPAIMA